MNELNEKFEFEDFTMPDQPGERPYSIHRVGRAGGGVARDAVAIEEPLEIRIEFGPEQSRVQRSISITMRTPGYDFELAAGFLFTEGIIRSAAEIQNIKYCGPADRVDAATNVVRLDLEPTVAIDMDRLTRHFYTSSSCGVCGKSSIEALRSQSLYTAPRRDQPFTGELIHRLPQLIRQTQGLFNSTGGIHASALISRAGEVRALREDVGRHNALDKLIGGALLHGALPLQDSILLVSGRASFELVQKASMAGIGVFAAIGAPSSLAIDLADDFGMTLIGFVRDRRFNIYSHPFRIDQGSANETEN